MASVYQSPAIAAPNAAAKRLLAYADLIVFLQHELAGTGGYAGDIVSADFAQTTANVVTLATSQLIPTEQLPRYNLALTGLTVGVVATTAAAIYQSPAVAAPNLAAKRVVAYNDLIVFLQHLRAGTGGYAGDIVSIDFGVTLANVVTLLLTQAIPPSQLPRFNLTRTA